MNFWKTCWQQRSIYGLSPVIENSGVCFICLANEAQIEQHVKIKWGCARFVDTRFIDSSLVNYQLIIHYAHACKLMDCYGRLRGRSCLEQKTALRCDAMVKPHLHLYGNAMVSILTPTTSAIKERRAVSLRAVSLPVSVSSISVFPVSCVQQFLWLRLSLL